MADPHPTERLIDLTDRANPGPAEPLRGHAPTPASGPITTSPITLLPAAPTPVEIAPTLPERDPDASITGPPPPHTTARQRTRRSPGHAGDRQVWRRRLDDRRFRIAALIGMLATAIATGSAFGWVITLISR